MPRPLRNPYQARASAPRRGYCRDRKGPSTHFLTLTKAITPWILATSVLWISRTARPMWPPMTVGWPHSAFGCLLARLTLPVILWLAVTDSPDPSGLAR